ncbi:MAG: YgiT-type zinc finger protein [Coleofasciculaceae cyanobacterium]
MPVIKETLIMLVPEKCPICGGHAQQEEVTETLQGGGNTATLNTSAAVCQLCGERYYSLETVRRFEEIETKLKKQDVAEFELVGQSFKVMQM